MVSSEELYNKFAQYYRFYSRKKRNYIDSIDKLILKNLPIKHNKVLDVGCGDGIRGIRLFKKMWGKKILMIDNSDEMVKLAKKLETPKIKVKKMDISMEKLRLEAKSDVILCLWNVLGHVPSVNQRLTTLKNMRRLLKNGGKIYIDISNRYNIRYYRLRKVFINILRDFLRPNPKNGDFDYKIMVSKHTKIDSTCHFFNPFEIESLIRKAGLEVKKRYSIDYRTGQLRKTFFEGHLLYVLEKSIRDLIVN